MFDWIKRAYRDWKWRRLNDWAHVPAPEWAAKRGWRDYW